MLKRLVPTVKHGARVAHLSRSGVALVPPSPPCAAPPRRFVVNAAPAVLRVAPLRPVDQRRSFAAVVIHNAVPEVSKSDVEKLIARKQENPAISETLIDVRNPDELRHGVIPTAVNVPLGEMGDALQLPPDAFVERYGFAKPATDARVVFYCRSGARSEQATAIALTHGFAKAQNYRGSFGDYFGFLYDL